MEIVYKVRIKRILYSKHPFFMNNIHLSLNILVLDTILLKYTKYVAMMNLNLKLKKKILLHDPKSASLKVRSPETKIFYGLMSL
jgi:hypothetical protein